MSKSKQYDLEERTFTFARDCRTFVKKLPKNVVNLKMDTSEANEALSKKDFVHRVKICKKESKESRLWLRLVDVSDNQFLDKERRRLIKEATELMKIFGSIIEKSK